jgi:N6-L-threonylcarbamoyladenine synthase
MTVLAIETSCDETAVAIARQTGDRTTIASNVVSSQIALHAPFGGVVPDLAAREHARNILPVLQKALNQAGVSRDDIDVIAVTAGPGLIPALIVGVAAAKTLAYVWHKPLLGIHHLEGHIYANFIAANSVETSATSLLPTFPLLALVVSGGHTQLILMRDHFTYDILGETLDDAAGEAFDKVAKMLGLPYPGGPVVAQRADAFIHNQSLLAPFPRPMLRSKDFCFSFSGLKTAVRYAIDKHSELLRNERFIDEVCYEFQEAVLDVLITKTERALGQYAPKTFVIAGGVSANRALRERLRDMIDQRFHTTRFCTPKLDYSLDNAAMIASAALFRTASASSADRKRFARNWSSLSANATLSL